MTMYIETSRPVPFGAEFSLKVVNFVDATVANFLSWNAARKTEKALNSLSDRQLEDIGMYRGAIKTTSLEVATRRYF